MNDYLAYRLKLKNEGKPPAVKKPYKIRQYSKKRQKANREYAEKSRPLWKGKECAINAPGCTVSAQCINHKKGKSSTQLLLDEKYWEPACFWCNNYIESNHNWAVKKGHKLTRM